MIKAPETLGMDYMVVGLSSMAYGIPRSTKDADLVLSVDTDAMIPAAEDVIVMKLRWYALAKRGKDHDDIRDVIAVQGEAALDWEYIHKWTDEHGTRELLDEIRASIPPID